MLFGHTGGLRNRAGPGYLIREKLFGFVEAAEQHPAFAAEMPAFGYGAA
jgi:hypothetical protein